MKKLIKRLEAYCKLRGCRVSATRLDCVCVYYAGYSYVCFEASPMADLRVNDLTDHYLDTLLKKRGLKIMKIAV